jgi:hypothetical protein
MAGCNEGRVKGGQGVDRKGCRRGSVYEWQCVRRTGCREAIVFGGIGRAEWQLYGRVSGGRAGCQGVKAGDRAGTGWQEQGGMRQEQDRGKGMVTLSVEGRDIYSRKLVGKR